MSRFLDLESWPRRRTFEYFRGYDKPYFNLCTSLEAMIETIHPDGFERELLAALVRGRETPLIYRGWGL